jgi:3-hydroxybutyryl-CoA dehydratase
MTSTAYGFHDLAVGQQSSRMVTFTEESVSAFSALTGDHTPVHVDAQYARTMGYQERIVHGMFVVAHFSTILGTDLPGPNTVIHSVQVSFAKPVLIGETVRYTVDISRLVKSVGVVQLNLRVESDSGALLTSGRAQCGFRKTS